MSSNLSNTKETFAFQRIMLFRAVSGGGGCVCDVGDLHDTFLFVFSYRPPSSIPLIFSLLRLTMRDEREEIFICVKIRICKDLRANTKAWLKNSIVLHARLIRTCTLEP